MAGFKEYEMLFKLNASLGNNYTSTFTDGGKAITDLQNKIEDLNKTQKDISAYEKQQDAVENCRTKMELYKTQLDNLKDATANTSVEEAKLANEIAAKEEQLQRATNSYDKASEKLSDMGQKLHDAGVDTHDLSGEQSRLAEEAHNAAEKQAELAAESETMSSSFKEAMEGAAAAIEAAGILTGLQKVYDLLGECCTRASDFEEKMAGVKRTVGGSDSFIDNLGESFKDMSTEIPISANELASIATTAGQLGVRQNDVETFTKIMAMLGTTTDLTADNAATMLAQFANITGVKDYERLGSTVAQLGDETATTASKVVDMSQGMAAAGSIAGMSATDILGISAAVGSLGIEAQAGSTAMSQLISKIYTSVETGKDLENYASIAGMTADEYKNAWKQDAAGGLNSFIQGLNDTERNGKSAIVVLDELGIHNVRQTKAVLGLAQAGDLLGDTIESANSAWRTNSALTEKANVMYETTGAKFTMMQNAANNVEVAVGDALNPTLEKMYETATDFLEPLADFIEENPALVEGVATFVGVLGTATAGMGAYAAATKLAAAASTLFGGAIPGIGIIVGVAGAIGILTAAFSALSGDSETTAEKMDSMDKAYGSLMDEFQDNQKISELCERYTELSEKLKDTTLTSEELKAIQSELSSVGEELAEATGGRIDPLNMETEALEKQIEAEKKLADVRSDLAIKAASENMTEQAKLYAQAIDELERSTENLQKIDRQFESMDSAENYAVRLTAAFEAVGEAVNNGEDWDSEHVKDLRREFEELYNAMDELPFDRHFDNLTDMDIAYRDLDIDADLVASSLGTLNEEMKDTSEQAEAAAAAMQTYIENAIDMATVGGASISEVREKMEADFAEYPNGAKIVDEAMAQVEAAVDAMAAKAELAAGSVDELNNSMESTDEAKIAAQSAIDEINVKLEELNEEYNKAYDAAYSSIDGQIGLFSEMSYEVDTSVGDMIAALQSQSAYMDEYATNLQEAARRGVDEGLLKSLSDGSTESAAYLAAIVASGDDAIADLNEAFKGVQEGKDSFAKTVAEMETDFAKKTEEMEQEVQDLQNTLNGLDGSGAGASLGDTLAAGIRSKIADVKRAVAELRSAAEIDDSNSSARTGMNANHDAHVGITRAYASGTQYAKRGLALVGEEGPELMWMNGGEKIATAEETARLARQATMEASPLNANTKNSGGNVYRIEVKPEYNFTGTSLSESDLQRIMGNNNQNLRIEVERILDDIQSDKARSVYV